jgi:hypothetical protein
MRWIKEKRGLDMLTTIARYSTTVTSSNQSLLITISHNRFEFSRISKISKSTSCNAFSNACANSGLTGNRGIPSEMKDIEDQDEG